MGRPSLRRRRRSFARSAWRVVARTAAAGGAVVVLLLLPATAAAHPLGNFTINHYAGLTVGRDSIAIDLVIDKAEIPAFQDRQDADQDGDGEVSDDEARAWAQSSCADIVGKLRLTVGTAPVTPAVGATTIAFPPGVGGLSTLRLECRLTATPPSPIDAATTITFTDTSFSERIGWREVIATGSGTILDTHGLPATSPSQRLTHYPAEMIAQPLDIKTATIDARPDPAAATSPVASTPAAAPAAGYAAAAVGTATLGAAAVPGGVASELPSVITSALSGQLSPLVWLGALGAAYVVGAFHALTPGHGKTVMAAYLVGTRGSPIHAVGLGLSVAVSHTLGILALALIVIAAEGALPPDVIARTTPVIAAASIIVIGGVMLVGQIRQRLAPRLAAATAGHDHEHRDDHEHGHDHDHGDDRGAAAADGRRHDHDADPARADEGPHRHGGVTHSHVPAAGGSLTWRGLFALGLTGGLIPSTSALVILLGSIVAGRAVLGLVLVVAFGLGMASVMSTVGLAMVFARGRLDRVSRGTRLGSVATAVPLVAAVAVIGIGMVLTWSAVAGQPVF